MSEHTPTTEEIRDVFAEFSALTKYQADRDEEAFNRWYAAEITSAEQRGAARALRDAADHLGNQGPITMSHREVYDHLSNRSHRLECDE